jgi:1-acyl-sn-glycerol-3-phosphate acyltransferase
MPKCDGLMYYLAKIIFEKILGWTLIGTIDSSVKKCVIAVVPHTSSYDFIMGLLIRSILRLRINYLGKKELFDGPLGFYFRWTGGAPLDRTSGQNKVEGIAKLFDQYDTFRLALSPEGTRKKVTKFKTGFYYIAKTANVPIIPIALDYAKKEVRIGQVFHPSGSIEQDMPLLEQHFAGAVGYVPENSWTLES